MKARSERSKVTMGDVMKYLGILMSVLYVATGVAVLGSPNRFFSLPQTSAYPLGSMLIAYGLFRAYRIYQRNNKD